jgi:hypothetical protein
MTEGFYIRPQSTAILELIRQRERLNFILMTEADLWETSKRALRDSIEALDRLIGDQDE